jgi:hypothetical protein
MSTVTFAAALSVVTGQPAGRVSAERDGPRVGRGLEDHDAGISSAGGRAETKRAVAAERNAAEAAADSPVS